MGTLTGILLAAGHGKRFGSNKLMYPLIDGEPLGVVSARHLISAVPRGIAVVRPGEEGLANALDEQGYRIVMNRHHNSGMGESISLAISASLDAEGWLIGLGDMPWINPSTIEAVVDRLLHGASIVAPSYKGKRGHPVGFSARWGDRLMDLHGESRGARKILADYPNELELLPTDDSGVIRDVDYLCDLPGAEYASIIGSESLR
jgi:molybdenum cofactor cytidylyltransferase